MSFFTCPENESVSDAENRPEASDTAGLPPTLPPLELDPVGDPGSRPPQGRLKGDDEDKDAGLGSKKAECEELRAGVAWKGKEGLRGDDWGKKAGEVGDEEEEESRRLRRKKSEIKELNLQHW